MSVSVNNVTPRILLTFNINDLSDVTIKVSNILGVTLFTETDNSRIGNYSSIIDLNTYSKGTYFLEIRINSQVYFRKLILN